MISQDSRRIPRPLLSGGLAVLLAATLVVADIPDVSGHAAGPPAAGAVSHASARVPAEKRAGQKLAIAKPRVKGAARIGQTLRARVKSTGTVRPALTYTWLRDGVRIRGAHKSWYRLRSKDRKHRISVRVTAKATGYRTVTKRSSPTKRVRPKAINDPRSAQVVVNKLRPLQPKRYQPSGLVHAKGIENTNGQPMRWATARALERMAAAARKDGVDFRIFSAFRSYDYQRSLYDSYVARDGRARADTYSARPGHSEHQTGFAVDLGDWSGCGIGTCFADTGAGRWLAKNSHRYGFILRYPRGYTHITGYTYEPWHFRYVGEKAAKEMKRKKIRTLEQYRGLKAAPDYR